MHEPSVTPAVSPPANDATNPTTTGAQRLRLWPGVALVAVQWLLMIVPAFVVPDVIVQFTLKMWAPMIVAVGLLIWWLFFSRLRWSARLLGVLAFAIVLVGGFFLCHPSLRLGFILYPLPALTTAWVGWLVLTPSLRLAVRLGALPLVFALAVGWAAFLRLDGVDGSFAPEFAWRWSPTAEEKFLASHAKINDKSRDGLRESETLNWVEGDWPAFRGPARDGRLTGVRIATDWKANPPRELWRRRVGPGWSSFVVLGDRLITQEQRGPDESVVCYDANSGAERWAFTDPARFTEAIGGPGPRATPTFHEGKLYVQGASGRLHCLNAASGTAVWSRDVRQDTDARLPEWGYAASPLVVDGLVITFAGAEGKCLAAYRADNGEPAWTAGDGQFSYCSPHLARIDGTALILLTTDQGIAGFDPASGKELWKHTWAPMEKLARVVQPTLIGERDVLLGTGFNLGTRRLHINRTNDVWAADEVWTTKAISPYFNDLVIHAGHIYGFDNQFFTCVNLDEPSKGRWRARGYGNGQVLLLADQGLLLILSEKGDVALLEAKPDKHTELARFKAFEGKTWNHPVIAHGKLFVRNSEEMACFVLARE